MNNIEKGVLSSVIDNNKQSHMATRDIPIQDLNVDWKLAGCIYYFLKGTNTVLPSFSMIERISKEKFIDGIISVGYGVIVTQKGKDIIISHSEPITEVTERIDEIRTDGYTAFTVNNDRITEIDPNEVSIFDPSRVRILQQYLTDYKEYRYNLNEEKEPENKKASSL